MSEQTVESEENLDSINEEREAIRAALAERYERERHQSTNDRDEESENDENSSEEQLPIEEVGTGEITGITPYPEVETDDIDSLINSTQEVKAVRFELNDGEASTPKYDWAPDDKSHELTKAVDYYANGDLTEMVGKTVDIHELESNNVLLSFPRPYTSRVAHLRYPLLRLLRTPEQNDSTLTSISVDRPRRVRADNEVENVLTDDGAGLLGMIVWAPLAVIAGLLFWMFGTTIGAISAGVSFLLLFVLGGLFGKPIKTAFYGLVVLGLAAVVLPLYSIKVGFDKVRELLSSVDETDPFEEP